MIRHCVLVRPVEDLSAAEWREVMSGLDLLVADLPGALSFGRGPNVSPEAGMDHGFSQGFVIDFTDEAARDDYLADPRHVALGERLLRLAENGTDGVLVFDLVVPAPPR